MLFNTDNEDKCEYTNTFIQQNENKILTYTEYINNRSLLKKCKVGDLKKIAKYYKLHISGTKMVLFQRVENLFLNTYYCIQIQKIFRGFVVRQSFKIRGEGFRDITKCVNESDFYSLEPLHEIPFQYFYTFTCSKFIYGCNIISLIHLIQTKTVVKNPYNRENLTENVIKDIVRLYSLIKLVFGLPDESPIIINDNKPVLPNPYITIIERRIQTLVEIRLKTVSERIRELFMEIDQLGNYTQSIWFSNLGRREYIRFYRTLYDIWNYRGQLSRETRVSICVLYDPFVELNRDHIHWYDVGIDIVREKCLKLMEIMIHCGIDDEYRKIGALHVLTALTNVSMGARNAMPWLYDILL
jgi:hypothetical protein